MGDVGNLLPPPYGLTDNEYSLLDQTDLVFIDPPYDLIETVSSRLFAQLDVLLRSHPDPLIIFELPGELSLAPAGWTCVKRLGKGLRQPTAAIFRANRALT